MKMPRCSTIERFFVAGLLYLFFPLYAVQADRTDVLPALQPLIDAAEPGEILVPPPGEYAGPVVVEKAITLDGRGKVKIDAGGKGSVLTINTSGATVMGLHLTNSGELHNDLDSGVMVRGNNNVVKDNVITNSLFGIDLSKAENCIIRRNKISSKPYNLGIRGDAIRLWYSKNNRISYNIITDSRDLVIWYSEDNIMDHNEIRNGRYGIHFMYSRYNLVEHNRMINNSVGIFLMYSDGVVVRDNIVSHGTATTGMGIGFKEASDMIVERNKIYYCARGMYLDVSPLQPESTNLIFSNEISYSTIGMLFHNDWVGNKLRNNILTNNYIQVSVNSNQSAKRNDWAGNYWDNYQGFDINKDGIGDSSHQDLVYADRLAMDVPLAAFFNASPVMSVLDFLERLAPLSEPLLLLEDKEPLMKAGTANMDGAYEAGTQIKDAGGQKRIDPFGLNS